MNRNNYIFQLQRTNEVDFYPVHLPDDVPVDFLVGNMDLLVTLPTQKSVRMSVERKYVSARQVLLGFVD